MKTWIVTPKVIDTWKLKLLVQTTPLRVKPEIQEVQVNGLPKHVAQLVVQAVQVRTPVAALPRRVPLCWGMKPKAHMVHILRDMH